MTKVYKPCLSSLVSLFFTSVMFCSSLPSLHRPLNTHSLYTQCIKRSIACQSHFIVLTVRTCDVRNHDRLNSFSIVFRRSHSLYTRLTKPWQTWMASQSYFIILIVRTRDVQNHDRLPPVWGLLRLAPINGFSLASHGQFTKHYRYTIWQYQSTSIKIYSQLGYPRPVECISLHSCERLKDDGTVAAFVSMHMHVYSMENNFHEIVLLHEKTKISTPRKKPAIWYVTCVL